MDDRSQPDSRWPVARREFEKLRALIHQWHAAHSHCQEEAVRKRFTHLQQGLGVVSLLLVGTGVEEKLAVNVNTLDNRYLLLRFTNPVVEVVH